MLSSALAYAAANKQAFLDEFLEYLKIPSVSAQPEHKADILRAAEFLRAHLADLGLRAEIMPTGGNPVVYAEWLHAPGAPTLLIYGHYDVQPAEPFELWHSKPFEPEIRDGAIYARGSDDNKGQHFAHIKALASYLRSAGSLPVNVKLLVEGEEEIGGNNLTGWVDAHRDLLACDCIMVSDGSLHSINRPTITYGLRGIVGFELGVTALARDVHSGHYGGNVQNPAIALAQIIAALKDEHGRVTIPGYYDDVRPLDAAERASLSQVPWSEDDIKRETGALRTFGDPDFSNNERKGARPTLEINGMWSGYTGPGSKTIIPATAHAKFTLRLVPFMNPDKVLQQAIAHIKTLTPPGVELTFTGERGSAASYIDRSSPLFQAAVDAATATYGNPPYFELEGGSIPVVTDFLNMLKKPVILLGMGLPDDAIHSPNEKYVVACFDKGIEASIRFIDSLANAKA
jgi:acetylornithine deacetylase/succinyl-diaminopimelate desuccinylase-like protein